MQIVILAQAESYYARDLARAAAARGHVARTLPFVGLAGGVIGGQRGYWSLPAEESANGTLREQLLNCDALLVRTMPPGTLEQVILRMNLLGQLEARGVCVLNPARSVECAVDKYLTTMRLVEARLPTPDTFVCETADAGLLAFAELGGDVVIKPLFGSEGRGILRVSDPDLAFRALRTLERLGAVMYLQRFIDHGGSDLRVMVLDGQVLGGMRRINPDDFRTNVSRSGRAEMLQVTDQQAEWAIRATAAVGARIAGVDLLQDRDGQEYVIEVNAVPGWKAFRQVTGVDVATRVIVALEAGRS